MADTPVTNIPAIMSANGFVNGALLLNTWFSRPSAIKPAYGPSLVGVIKMAWVLSYRRSSEVYQQILDSHLWANANGRKEIRKLLAKLGFLTANPTRFGNTTAPVQILDLDYVTYGKVGFGVGDIDDLSAALGNFLFRVAVAGEVKPISASKHQVTVNEVAIYVWDTFDFNGDQFLGFWDDTDNSVSILNPLSGTKIGNADFQAHRKATGQGGDFLIYSDVNRVPLLKPDVFEV